MSSDSQTGVKYDALDEVAQKRLKEIGSADIIIGIPSYNNADSIGRVIKAADLGLAKYFPDKKGVILISEGGDLENTKAAVEALKDKLYFDSTFIARLEHETEILVTKYQGPSGKGTAIKALFEAADLLNVKAGSMLDSDLRSISPEWLELLITPVIMKDFGFVTPYYSRHKYDGTITNMIAYPLTRSLYGRRVRQPIGGDFGFSIELIRSLLAKDVWETDIARFGIDIWMTTVAICEDFKICQSFLGTKIHDDKDPGNDLSPMFKQVVGTIFRLMGIYRDQWIGVTFSRPTAIFGFESEAMPKPVNIDIENLIRKFKDGSGQYFHIWEKVLESENYSKVQEVTKMESVKFEMPTDLWIRVLVDFAYAYNHLVDGLTESDIIEALVPIYYAKTASFVLKSQNHDTHQAEELINEQSEAFEQHKPYLISRWDIR
ncbi:MAG: glycosyl transferase family 2 [Nitrospira sp.]|nr:glycosyl transferase family 2 [bacterium]MBL7049137.1 glycosyl transferase family 2 [Nitrospira sp.]